MLLVSYSSCAKLFKPRNFGFDVSPSEKDSRLSWIWRILSSISVGVYAALNASRVDVLLSFCVPLTGRPYEALSFCSAKYVKQHWNTYANGTAYNSQTRSNCTRQTTEVFCAVVSLASRQSYAILHSAKIKKFIPLIITFLCIPIFRAVYCFATQISIRNRINNSLYLCIECKKIGT